MNFLQFVEDIQLKFTGLSGYALVLRKFCTFCIKSRDAQNDQRHIFLKNFGFLP